MATKSIDIAVTVREKATRPLKRVENQMRRTGKQARNTSVDFTQFNRVLFSTTAFVGTFAFAMSRLARSMDEAAKFDRIETNFERTLGPKGEFIKQLHQMTDRSVDIFSAMQAGIELRSLGIVQSSNQIAEISARASAMAANVGKTSQEGIRAFTQFLKDGSISHLQFLGLIQQANTGLKLSESIISKYGGVMSGALTTAQRLAIGLDLLRKKTDGTLKGQRDFADIIEDVQIFSRLATQDIKMMSVEAFAPLLDKVKEAAIGLSSFVENIRKSDKEILFLVRSFGVATAAVVGLVTVLGTLRLSIIALGSIGLGVPLLTTALGLLGASFLGITSGAEGFIQRLKIFGGVFKGTFQLVKSFLTVPENFKKGIGEMDSSLANLLRQHGLLDLVTQMSRVIAVSAQFAKGVAEGFKEAFSAVVSVVGGAIKSIMQLFGMDSGPWTRGWLDSATSIGKTVGKLTVGLLALVGAFKALKAVTGVAGSIGGLIGKLSGVFKSGNKTPTGTPSNPLFVRMLNAIPGFDSLLGKKESSKTPQRTPAKGFLAGSKSALNFISKGLLGGILGGLGYIVANQMGAEEGEEKKPLDAGNLMLVSTIGSIVASFLPLGRIISGVGKGLNSLLGKLGLSSNMITNFGASISKLGPIKGILSGMAAGAGALLTAFGRLTVVGAAIYAAWSLLSPLAKDIYNNWDRVSNIGIYLYVRTRRAIDDFVSLIDDLATKIGGFVGGLFGGLAKQLDQQKPVKDQSTAGQLTSFFRGALASGLESVGFDNLAKTVATPEQLDLSRDNEAKVSVISPIEQAVGLADVEGTKRIADALQKGQMPKNYELSQSNLTDDARRELLTNIQSQLEGEQKEKFKSAFEQAMTSESTAGTRVTKDEFMEIMYKTVGRFVETQVEEQKTTNEKLGKVETQDSKIAGAC